MHLTKLIALAYHETYLKQNIYGFMKEHYDKKYFNENATVGTNNHLLRRAVYSDDWHCFTT